MTGVTSILHDLPGDIASAMRVLEDLFGGPGPVRATAAGTTWPGGIGAAGRAEAGVALRGAAGALPRGAIGAAGGIATASAIMQEIQRSAERRQVEAAIQRFRLDPNDAAQLLSARAYVWGRNIAPMLFWDVPYTGETNDRVAQAIGRFERDNPGTLGAATYGSAAAQKAIAEVVREAVAAHGGIFAPPVLEYRASAVDPALSASGTRARAAANIQRGNRSWIAHHLLTFMAVARLPGAVQQHFVAAGWKMDSAENLIALPANLATYLSLGPTPLLPYHAGAHPNYTARVDAALAAVTASPATGQPLRDLLKADEDALRVYIRSVAPLGLLR